MHYLANSLHTIHLKKAFLYLLLPLKFLCCDLKTVAEIEISSGGGVGWGKILNELTTILPICYKCDIIYYLG